MKGPQSTLLADIAPGKYHSCPGHGNKGFCVNVGRSHTPAPHPRRFWERWGQLIHATLLSMSTSLPQAATWAAGKMEMPVPYHVFGVRPMLQSMLQVDSMWADWLYWSCYHKESQPSPATGRGWVDLGKLVTHLKSHTRCEKQGVCIGDLVKTKGIGPDSWSLQCLSSLPFLCELVPTAHTEHTCT